MLRGRPATVIEQCVEQCIEQSVHQSVASGSDETLSDGDAQVADTISIKASEIADRTDKEPGHDHGHQNEYEYDHQNEHETD